MRKFEVKLGRMNLESLSRSWKKFLLLYTALKTFQRRSVLSILNGKFLTILKFSNFSFFQTTLSNYLVPSSKYQSFIMEFASPFPNIHRHASTQYVLLGSTVFFTILSHSEFAGSGLHSNGSGVVSIQCDPTSQLILSNRISIRQLLIPSPPYFGGHVHVKDPGVLTQVALGTIGSPAKIRGSQQG